MQTVRMIMVAQCSLNACEIISIIFSFYFFVVVYFDLVQKAVVEKLVSYLHHLIHKLLLL